MIPRWFFYLTGFLAGFGALAAAGLWLLALAASSGAGWRSRVEQAVAGHARKERG